MVDAWQRHRFFEGLARALMAVGRPTLLVLDNMQWCDQETLAFITFFLGLAADTPALVAGTCRDDAFDDDPELAAWTVRMRATGLLTELSLGPLDAAGTARLAEAISGLPLPESDADLLAGRDRGFPLYIVEAMRGRDAAASTPLPAGDLAAVLRNRLEQASAAAREVAGLAAAVGDELHPRPAHRGERPGRRHGRGGRRRAVAAPDHARVPRRLRLLPRPASRDGLRAGQPAEAVAAAPAGGAGARAAPSRRRGRGLGPARRAVRPRRAAQAGRGLLPAGRRRRRGQVRPRRGDPAAQRGADDRAQPAGGTGTGIGGSSTSWRRSPRRSMPGTATRRRGCSRRSSARSSWRSRSDARTPPSPAWSRCG